MTEEQQAAAARQGALVSTSQSLGYTLGMMADYGVPKEKLKTLAIDLIDQIYKALEDPGCQAAAVVMNEEIVRSAGLDKEPEPEPS